MPSFTDKLKFIIHGDPGTESRYGIRLYGMRCNIRNFVAQRDPQYVRFIP